MRKSTKVIGLLLATAMTFSFNASAFVRNPVSGKMESATLGSGKRTFWKMSPTDELGQILFVPSGNRLAKVTIKTASWGNAIGDLTFNIYKWQGTYQKTVSGKPEVTKTFHNFADNSALSVSVDMSKNLDGQLLLTVGGAVEDCGPWYYDVANSAQYNFFENGEPSNLSFDGQFFWTKIKAEGEKISDIQRNAFEPIDMFKYDVAEALNEIKVSIDGKTTDVINVANGSYAGYGNVDFGNGVTKGVEFQVYSAGVNRDAAQIQVVLDNPTNGKVIAECQLEYHEAEYIKERLSCEITEKITGVHDVYVTFTDNGYYPLEMRFTKTVPEEDYYAKRLREFNETMDFTIKENYSDTWVATDMLGRKVADYNEAGDKNPDKQVGMFYWTWHATHEKLNLKSFSNNQAVLDSYNGDISEIMNNPSYGKWGETGFWNESVYGHYHGLDAWVMRKQMELLGAAGIDGLFFDCTNGAWAWTGGYMTLCKVLHEMHLDGIETPGISFMLPFGDGENTVSTLETIYEHMYAKGLYSDTWYYWKGKPVLMSYYNSLLNETDFADVNKNRREIYDFFTFRPGQASYFTGPGMEDHWPWLEVAPQHPFGKSNKYGCETVGVSTAQNASGKSLVAMNGTDVNGRSYTYKNKNALLSENSKLYGYNFQEQWDRAFELDPEFVFVTGWNEWTAGLHDVWGGQNTKAAYPDQFNDEYSRDIEPSKGDLKDVYYYQLVDNVRKFKGVNKPPVVSKAQTVDLDGGFEQWQNVKPEFVGYKGGTENRNARGMGVSGNPVYYTNSTGRNDIVLSKVARDAENLYFYVETAENLTPYTDDSWMRLFINSDRTYKTGWEGYDYALNIEKATADNLVLSKSANGWNWEKVLDVEYTIAENKMMVKIPRNVLGIGDNVDIEFKWNDNMQEQGDIMDFYTSGDTAPIGRFNYLYTEDHSKAKRLVDEPTLPVKEDKDFLRYSIVMKVGKSKAFVKNSETVIDASNPEITPIIVKDKTMVPIRFLTENLGAQVTWDEETQTAKILLNGKRIFITIGSNTMRIEKEKVTLQSPAFEQGGRIYIPLRDVVELSGESCNWFDPDIIVVGGRTADFYVRETMVETINKMFE